MPYAKSADFSVDLSRIFVTGLDIFIHNRGASSLTVSIDVKAPITVLAGDSFGVNDVKFYMVDVVSSVAYDLVVAGKYMYVEEVEGTLVAEPDGEIAKQPPPPRVDWWG